MTRRFRSRHPVKREGDGGGGSTGLVGADGGGALMELGNFADEGEAEAISFRAMEGGVVFGAVGVESLECPGRCEVGNAASVVGDADCNTGVIVLQRKGDRASIRGKLNGVFKKMIQGRAKERFITSEVEGGGEVAGEGDLLGLSERAELIEAVLTTGHEVEGAGVLEMSLGFEGGELEEAVDEPLAASGLGVYVP